MRYRLMSESASKIYLEGDSDIKSNHSMVRFDVIAL
jgi:hypothetical protein